MLRLTPLALLALTIGASASARSTRPAREPRSPVGSAWRRGITNTPPVSSVPLSSVNDVTGTTGSSFVQEIPAAAVQGLKRDGPKRAEMAPAARVTPRANIPGFTGPSIEADLPASLLPNAPHARRFIRNADFQELGASPSAANPAVADAIV